MLTRTFLFLLAMMSGLSAAQAAERVRPVQSEIGAGTSSAIDAASALVEDSAGAIDCFAPVHAYAHAVLQDVKRPVSYAAPVTARVFIGDRNRQ